MISGFFTRRQAADKLGVTPQRVSAIAKRDDWSAVQVGRSWLYEREDVERTAIKMAAQKAWALLGIPRNRWGEWWLADPDSIGVLPCPACGGVAYTPAGETEWTGGAACPSCGWLSSRAGR